ncbi:discoidin, CUB and LCCL domain-containing protein 1-like isoform X2 [Rhinatrema bivittatum]|uniref:discoidin, CUB and LCCL domain-containing protein 1-like isoform X2 n=1 Tax=Rhinatrema bivittatum TaxID=194408 RepID=UPI0011285316|nr:discoidin, CUB and LCCL domain-containing protein 1-like isoform X2 [Rhinatrema bivittatum]
MRRAKGRAAARSCPALLLLRALLVLLGPASGQKGDGCGHTVLSPQSGTLASKNYPGTYPNWTLCEWSIQVSKGNALLLTFGDLDIEYSEGCISSFLQISTPSPGLRYGPYCGTWNQVNRTLSINSSAATILFNSTIHRSGRGFLLSYAGGDHPVFSALLAARMLTVTFGEEQPKDTETLVQTSVICKAAVHAGVISDEVGGQVTLSQEKGITLYEPAWANGLQSKTGSLSEKRLVFHRVCSDLLDVAHFNASSSWQGVDPIGQHVTWSPERASFVAETAPSSWVAGHGRVAEWLEIDLGSRKNITGIITKGSADAKYNFYVTSYKILSSRYGINWKVYKSGAGKDEKVFEGNTEPRLEVYNAFIPPILARYLRVAPQSWNQRIALKVALLGCQAARSSGVVLINPKVIAGTTRNPTGHPTGHPTTIPAVAISPKRTGLVLLEILIIAGSLLLMSALILLVFLCWKKRKGTTKGSCSFLTGYQKAESGPACCRGPLRPCGSELVPYTVEGCTVDPSRAPTADYVDSDLLQVLSTTQKWSSTFKPVPDEGYMLPLVQNHYNVPGKYHEYAEPLPLEPEYATPFADQGPESAASRKNICVVKVIPLSCRKGPLASAPLSAQSRYDCPAPRGVTAEEGTNGTGPGFPRGYSASITGYAEPQPERTSGAGGGAEYQEPIPPPSTSFRGRDSHAHVYHELL